MSTIDSDRLRDVLSSIPPGGWMSYGDVAHVCGGIGYTLYQNSLG